jgi:hypothetical protein
MECLASCERELPISNGLHCIIASTLVGFWAMSCCISNWSMLVSSVHATANTLRAAVTLKRKHNISAAWVREPHFVNGLARACGITNRVMDRRVCTMNAQGRGWVKDTQQSTRILYQVTTYPAPPPSCISCGSLYLCNPMGGMRFRRGGLSRAGHRTAEPQRALLERVIYTYLLVSLSD